MRRTVLMRNILLLMLAAAIVSVSAQTPAPRSRAIDYLTLPPVTTAADRQSDKVIVKEPWLQENPPGQRITAAFMKLENHSSTDAVLVASHTSVARVVEIHQVVTEDGLMKMRKLEQLVIPAKASVELKPGGFHLMVIGVNQDLKAGDEVRMVLKFADATEKTIVVPVRRRTSD